ncbi:MAG: alpha/beta hydrolase, partial [Chitinophagaceae bacterium]
SYTLIITIIIFSFEIFYPRSYNVPHLKERPNTQYWDLSSGSKIGYTLIQGKGNKKQYPIIYLHGGPGGHITDRDFQAFTSLADSGFDIYLYDQIGNGQSERLVNIKDYTVARHIEDLNEIIKKINANKVILIGQSWGSIFAALFVANYSDKIEKIIFTSPGPIFPVHQELAGLQSPDSFHLKVPFYSNAQGNKIANNIRTKAMAFLATKFDIKLATDKEADDFATYLNYEVNKSTVCDTSNILKEDAGSGFYASIMTFNSLTKVNDQRPNLKNLKTPVLVIKGQCDNQKWGFTNEYCDRQLQLHNFRQLGIHSFRQQRC